MDQLEATKRIIRRHIWLTLLLENIIFGLCIYITTNYLNLKLYIDFGISAILALVFITLIAFLLSNFIILPLSSIRQAILHLSPTGTDLIKAPDVNKLPIGQELITNLIGQLYEIAKVGHDGAIKDGSKPAVDESFIANSLPLPLLILDSSEVIKFANKAAADYLELAVSDLIDKNVYTILDMSFPTDKTFDNWLKDVKQKTATASATWDRVRLNTKNNHQTLLFDLAAYYNQGNKADFTTIIVLFDHTKIYSQEDQAIGFVALSVHELRTPLTLLKGYIEVFEDELKGKVSPEIESFLDKMQATSEQLTAFVNNILNVARVEDDQLELKLLPEDWPTILSKTIEDIKLQAKVRGISLELNITKDLPKVGVDRLSIQEVINNLIDNAIKYSGSSKTIKISSYLNGEGLVETTVEDFGVGVPQNAVDNLFTKFYRDHRNRSQVGGTGLGLYLCKAIVTAHGGNIWVRSKEGQGSTFGFTLIPYDQLSKDLRSEDNNQIIRSAHGWIKNHSYYRR